MSIFPAISDFIGDLNPAQIPADRKVALDELASYLSDKARQKKPARLHFICTHNSRRSQFAQVWATVLGNYYGIELEAFSGGVEVTEANPRVIRALAKTGFQIEKVGDENPEYSLKYSSTAPPILLFSKHFDHPSLSSTGFAAIMVCSDADENCPFIPGAELRFPLQYDDPKRYDGFRKEAQQYLFTSRQIATELSYLFAQI